MIKPYYQDDHATIYLGDSRKIIPELAEVDHIISDPPYSSYVHAKALSNKDGMKGGKPIDFDSITFEQLRELIGTIKLKRWFIATCSFEHTCEFMKNPPEGLRFMRAGVWLKTNPMPQISADRPAQGWESICYMHTMGRSRWNNGGGHGNYYGATDTQTAHPTAKPLKMVQGFVQNFTDPGETVLDPFMGSGSTRLACKNLGRKAIGIELDQKYADLAIKRLRQGVLF